MTSSELSPIAPASVDALVTLWRCPTCGKTEADTSQSARYCGSTRACVGRDGARTTLTAMERWVYSPQHRKEDA